MQPYTLLNQVSLTRNELESDSRAPATRALTESVVAEFVARAHRVVTFATLHHAHRASWRAPRSTPLERTLRALHGKLVVVNRDRFACLPLTVAAALRGIWRDGAGATRTAPAYGPVGADSRAHTEARRARALLDAFPHGASMLRTAPHRRAMALYEPTVLTIRRSAATVAGDAERFAAEVPYRVAIFVDERAASAAPPVALGTAEAARAVVEAPAWTWRRDGVPAPWFVADVLMPDDDALRQMTPDAATAYVRVTGRQRANAVDRYWHLSAWERYEEAGRVVGYVTPEAVSHGGVRVTSGADARATRLTPAHDRGVLVPPGYCLVRCVGTLEVSVLRVASR